MNRASEYGREIGRLAALVDRHPEAEGGLFDQIHALMQPEFYAEIETAADALSVMVVAINEAEILAQTDPDDPEAGPMWNRVSTALYGIVAFLERASNEPRGLFGGDYLILDSERDPRRPLREEAA